MQKIVIAAALGALALTGCTNNTKPVEPTTQIKHDAKHDHHHAHAHKKGHGYKGTHPHFYQCESNTKLVAHPDTESDIIKIDITAPSLNLINQTIELKQAPSGSGERYINDKNPASVYEWHANGHEGIFTVKIDGTDYDYRCQSVKPPKKGV